MYNLINDLYCIFYLPRFGSGIWRRLANKVTAVFLTHLIVDMIYRLALIPRAIMYIDHLPFNFLHQ